MRLRSLRFALLCALCVSALNLAAAPRPNVLLLCVDDLKPALGCYGDQLPAAQPEVVTQLRAILARHPEAVPPGNSSDGKAKR